MERGGHLVVLRVGGLGVPRDRADALGGEKRLDARGSRGLARGEAPGEEPADADPEQREGHEAAVEDGGPHEAYAGLRGGRGTNALVERW